MSADRASALSRARAQLCAAGIAPEEAERDARFLLAHVLDAPPARLAAESGAALGDDEAARFTAMIARRAGREPVSQIIGMQPFWTLELEVTADVLTPRPDTETLVEAALAAVAERGAPLRLLDLGTGSGAILLALLSELPAASGLGADASEAALSVARRNAARCGLAQRSLWRRTSWAEGLEGRFDLIVSNPPYIATGVIEGLAPEVRDHEPRLALDGGPDGLEAFRILLPEALRLLAPGGTAVFEIGFDQAAAVSALACETGWRVDAVLADLAGHDRVLRLRADAEPAAS